MTEQGPDWLNLDPNKFLIRQWKGIRIPEQAKCLLTESRILGFGTRNTAQGIQNPNSTDKDWNPVPLMEAGIHDLESRILDCGEFPFLRRS